MPSHYDYIIAGSGAAGMSLLMRMMNDAFFSTKKILVLDKETKRHNDRTWCFWEKEADIFESVVHHRWTSLKFQSEKQLKEKNISPYQYKMIRSADMYAYVLNEARKHSNIEIMETEVISISEFDNQVLVSCAKENYTADHVFNGIIFSPLRKQKKKTLLLQHFKGWFIETKSAHFNPSVASFMDFRVSQQKGTAFVYCLPVADNRALIEYTLFTESVLPDEEYEKSLADYIRNILSIEEYTVTEKEFGIIPMTDIDFPKNSKRITHIGTAGGWTKASTGFTFKFIQKNTAAIVRSLKDQKQIVYPSQGNRFKFYDSVLLNVLAKKRMEGRDVFDAMFAKNEMQKILAFLDNETTVSAEIKILNSLPYSPFIQAAAQKILGY